MNAEKRDKSTTTDGQPPVPGYEGAPAPKPINPETGQHFSYWVLSEAERAKGFLRPLRRSYRHVGPPGPVNPLRDLTPAERERYQAFPYVKYEEYPPSASSVTGRFWTQAKLDRVGDGCQKVTTMAAALCETWARDPSFYGSTFCCGCGTHLPVGEFVWVEDGAVLGS